MWVDVGLVLSLLWVLAILPFLAWPYLLVNLALALLQAVVLRRRYDEAIWTVVRHGGERRTRAGSDRARMSTDGLRGGRGARGRAARSCSMSSTARPSIPPNDRSHVALRGRRRHAGPRRLARACTDLRPCAAPHHVRYVPTAGGRTTKEHAVGRADGMVALISGGARGMGATHARTLVGEGASVVIDGGALLGQAVDLLAE